MTAVAPKTLSSEEFIAWAMTRPEGERYELVAGEIVAMAPERAAHARLKFRIARRLAEAIEAAGLNCEVFTDGMAVQIDAATVYEPDALVRCGPDLNDAAVQVLDPVIVVEVLSPSSRARDAGAKLADYFRLPSLRHYLILKTENQTAIHHVRDEQGRIETRIVSPGALRLHPPGIELSDIFPA
ncbi:MAG: Uma2 family endonuclease [Acetobacteraceae bacterium]|nr:Uma2 family endonuclease [Acetobacteraceae bacterium]